VGQIICAGECLAQDRFSFWSGGGGALPAKFAAWREKHSCCTLVVPVVRLTSRAPAGPAWNRGVAYAINLNVWKWEIFLFALLP